MGLQLSTSTPTALGTTVTKARQAVWSALTPIFSATSLVRSFLTALPTVHCFARAIGIAAPKRHRDVSSADSPTTVSHSAHFQAVLGGGVDVVLKPSVAIRAAQLDYVRTNYPSRSVNQLRYSACVVLRVGRR
jgi:hypothetical protein